MYSLPTDLDKENEKTEEARINRGEENTDCDLSPPLGCLKMYKRVKNSDRGSSEKRGETK